MLVEIARAKVNLALHVLGRRADGYHMLDSIVGFADFGDRLTFAKSPQTSLTISGPFGKMLAPDHDNTVLKAVAALETHNGGKLPSGVAITLEKNLPVASGIGGGSSDAAATLRGLVRLWNLKLKAADIRKMALKLGADVPVCMDQSYCRMRGVGEDIQLLGAPPWPAIVLVNPRMSQQTQAVFRELGLEFGQRFRSGLEPERPGRWRNDLQAPATGLLPIIAKVSDVLTQLASGKTVRMSGSGATCFAACDSVAESEALALKLADVQPSWWVTAGKLM